jgi:hypothetical protein
VHLLHKFIFHLFLPAHCDSCQKIRRTVNVNSNVKCFKIPGGYTIPILAYLFIIWLLSNLESNEFIGIGLFIFILSLIYLLMNRSNKVPNEKLKPLKRTFIKTVVAYLKLKSQWYECKNDFGVNSSPRTINWTSPPQAKGCLKAMIIFFLMQNFILFFQCWRKLFSG